MQKLQVFKTHSAWPKLIFFLFFNAILIKPVETSLQHLSIRENGKNQIANIYRFDGSAVNVIDGFFNVRCHSSNIHSLVIIKSIAVRAARTNHV